MLRWIGLTALLAGCAPAVRAPAVALPVVGGPAASGRAPRSAPLPAARVAARPQTACGLDFGNWTYPIPAEAAGRPGARVQYSDNATPEVTEYGDIDLSLLDVRCVDLTGDGELEAVVLASAYEIGSNIPGYQMAYVYDAGGRLVQVVEPAGGEEGVAYSRARLGGGRSMDAVRGGVSLDGATLRVGGPVYGPRDAMCCPWGTASVALQWTGTRFAPAGSVDAERFPANPTPQPAESEDAARRRHLADDPHDPYGWEVMLDRIGPVVYGMSLSEAARASAGVVPDVADVLGDGCAEVRPERGPYRLTFVVDGGRVVGSRVDGFGYSTRSYVGIGSNERAVRDAYAGRVAPVRFGDGRAGLVYAPQTPGPNRLGLVLAHGRVSGFAGGRADVVAAGGTCP